ncbi:hypothetical protein PHYSODRAFT_249999 [Phytophthora sojae]|uniref:Alpha/beta hydrolase fold-3 domain-containing protein n=1 Tax=Phytophthora sojae (strain P6497) TaxID=1094619 RepID=G5AIQ5_PHYSP|nr:hypothetical protein PHYSODRAFT_249999 [Phytophthora sojae]EGZ04581.1 hypothetical protein PHYSODRAFT_249999 [Phytophthora sojae]|eukprot:XP_009539956.1 hypothetical protein PHYSODRAFT_249999 [Phytophthora sojae]
MAEQQAIPWALVVAATTAAVAVAALNASLRGVCRSPLEAVSLTARIAAAVAWTFVRYVARGFRPEFPKWTLRFELLRAAIRTVNELYGDRMVQDAQHARVIRAQSEAVGSILGWFYCRWYCKGMEPVNFNGLEHLWLRPKDPKKTEAKRLVVMYEHGGAFSLLSPRFYSFFCASLAASIERELGRRGSSAQVEIFLANYHKTPEFCFPTQPKEIIAAYKHLLDHEGLSPNQIILAGDSAGGGLVMSTLLRLRDDKPNRLPLAAIVCSPFVDMSESIDPASARSCILTRSIAKAARLVYHPTCSDRSTWAGASAVHCNLSGLPPVFIQAATLDYLYQDSVRLAEKAKADGVEDWELDVNEGVSHVFSLFPSWVLPYGQVGVEKMAAFAAKQFIKS